MILNFALGGPELILLSLVGLVPLGIAFLVGYLVGKNSELKKHQKD